MLDLILKDFKLRDEDVLNVYPYGSRVYGTNTEQSDHDFIIVTKDGLNDRDELESSYHNFNATIYSQSSFTEKLNQHKISLLECYFLPQEMMLKSTITIPFKYNKDTLRDCVFQKALRDIGKAKRKMGDDTLIAKKSLFHSLRILDFAWQIVQRGKIIYWSNNDIWEDIITNPSEAWEDYKNYELLFEERSSLLIKGTR